VTLPFSDVMSKAPSFARSPKLFQRAHQRHDGHYLQSIKCSHTTDEMAAFTTRTLDSALRRGNRRAALNI
jgi:hypothetical protein